MTNLYFPTSVDRALRANLAHRDTNTETRRLLCDVLGNDGDSVDAVTLVSYQGEELCRLSTEGVTLYAALDSVDGNYGLYYDDKLFAYLKPARPAAKTFRLDPCHEAKLSPLEFVRSSIVAG